MVTDAYKVLDNHNHLDPSAPIKFLVTAMFSTSTGFRSLDQSWRVSKGMNSFISARFEIKSFPNCFTSIWSLSFYLYCLVKGPIRMQKMLLYFRNRREVWRHFKNCRVMTMWDRRSEFSSWAPASLGHHTARPVSPTNIPKVKKHLLQPNGASYQTIQRKTERSN